MTAQAGKDMLLKIEGTPVASPGVFTTVAGLRARTISLNAKTVDATDGDSAGRWRELFFDQAAKRWRLIVPDFGVLEGPFLVAALEYAGEHEGEATFALSLASAGAIGFSAI